MRHLEQLDDEFFLGNAGRENKIGWKTKRLGSVAYDIYGNILDELFPVFVKKDEIKDHSQKLFDKFVLTDK